MIDVRGPYRNGAALAGISAVLFCISPLFVTGAAAPVLFGLICAALAFGLFQGLRWCAYLAFLALMVSSVFALTQMWPTEANVNWVFVAVFGANWAAIFALFAALWQNPQQG